MLKNIGEKLKAYIKFGFEMWRMGCLLLFAGFMQMFTKK